MSLGDRILKRISELETLLPSVEQQVATAQALLYRTQGALQALHDLAEAQETLPDVMDVRMMGQARLGRQRITVPTHGDDMGSGRHEVRTP